MRVQIIVTKLRWIYEDRQTDKLITVYHTEYNLTIGSM